MEVFWINGYEATSVQDLIDAMGINRGSMYDTFGDKHALFTAAINHYGRTITQSIEDTLDGPGSPLGNIRKLLNNINASNRDIANQRLDELTSERNSIESQLTSLNLFIMGEADIKELAQETILFKTSLDSTLNHGLFDDRRSAIRQCVENIIIDRDHGQALNALRLLPTFVGDQSTAKTTDVNVPIKIGK